jgi:hypothetical protein
MRIEDLTGFGDKDSSRYYARFEVLTAVPLTNPVF